MLSLLRESAAVIGRKQSAQKETAVAKKADTKLLAVLIDSLSNLDSIDHIEVGGMDTLNNIKLNVLIDSGRDFALANREMSLVIRRFLKALFAENPTPTMAQIDQVIEDAVIAQIALRLQNGGGDAKSTFTKLSDDYLRRKRRDHPNAKGIGWATGTLAHEWAENGNVRIVRK
jgi:hypothetical protein